MTVAVPAAGRVEPGYEDVAATFAAVAGGGTSAFAAVVEGRVVLDLRAGGWEPDTTAVLFSGTKGVLATVLMLLADRGALDLDAPVAEAWPEFAAAGKAAITTASLLAHAAGLPGVERPLARADLARPRDIAALLAAQAPLVEPGGPCYHALTWGWLAGEVCHRAAGAGPGALVAELLAVPLGIDVGIGTRGPAAARVAPPRPAAGYRLSAYTTADPDPRLALVYRNPEVPAADWGTPDVLAAEVAAAGGVATATAMARLYATAAGGLVRPATLARATRPAAAGADPLTGRPLRFGPTGYELAGTPSELGPAADAFGHTGTGGGSSGAWPSLRTGFALLTADLRREDEDGRAGAVLAALHRVVAGA